ncbi:MAG: SCO1664 family protein [Acidimicrobiales bacterium]
MPKNERPPAPDHLTVLSCGEVEILGRLPWSSNRTYLANVTLGDVELQAVYKPGRGERPLWDFGDNLWRREVAAYEVSCTTGWNIVPETVARIDAPIGKGSMQRFVPADFEQHYFTLFESEAHHDRLKSICAFDVVTNNADRKSGHCLLGEDGTIWGIDNGLCFHEDPKLRTVIWEFEGQPLPEEAVEALTKLTADFEEVSQQLVPLLDPDEIEAVKRRAERLLATGKLPKSPRGGPHYPWPLV